jgi:hypothetical protein
MSAVVFGIRSGRRSDTRRFGIARAGADLAGTSKSMPLSHVAVIAPCLLVGMALSWW